MELIVKKTHEMTSEEVGHYCEAYSEIFQHKKTPELFKAEFLNTCLGYSFHSILREDDGRIVGGYTAIPMPYVVNGEKQLFAFGVDLMIAEGYRDDVSNLMTVIKANDKALKEAGIICFYGFPNDNSYKVNLAFIRMKDICSLSTYILPYKIGDAKPILKILNPVSMLTSHIMLGLSKLRNRTNQLDYIIRKDRPEYDIRYQWFDAKYGTYKNDEMECHWKESDFDGIKATFLMDVYPMSRVNFDKATRIVFNKCKQDTGIIIYVGHLPFTPITMFKVPHRFEPKNFHFVGKSLNKSIISNEEICDVQNWDVNLASYDLL